MSSTHEVTRLLGEWAKGNQEALDELVPLVYAIASDKANITRATDRLRLLLILPEFMVISLQFANW
jgi:hypothetical protein